MILKMFQKVMAKKRLENTAPKLFTNPEFDKLREEALVKDLNFKLHTLVSSWA